MSKNFDGLNEHSPAFNTEAIAPTEREAFENACRKLAAMPEHAHEKLFGNDDLDTWWALWKEARCTPSPKAPAPSVEQPLSDEQTTGAASAGEYPGRYSPFGEDRAAFHAWAISKGLASRDHKGELWFANRVDGQRLWKEWKARALQSAHAAGGQS